MINVKQKNKNFIAGFNVTWNILYIQHILSFFVKILELFQTMIKSPRMHILLLIKSMNFYIEGIRRKYTLHKVESIQTGFTFYCSFASLRWSRELRYKKPFLLLMVKFYRWYFAFNYNLLPRWFEQPVHKWYTDHSNFNVTFFFKTFPKICSLTSFTSKVTSLVNHY